MLGAGRPAKRPSIEGVRELTLEEVATVPRKTLSVIMTLRDSHHMMARLAAMGLRTGQIAAKTGYSLTRVSLIMGSPAFKKLVADYHASVDEEWRQSVDEYFENAVSVRTTSLRLIRDRLEDAEPGDIPLNQLVAIHADTADRTGYPKRRESVNLNLDFAEKLERAIKRSAEAKTIEHSPSEPETSPQPEALPRDGAGEAAATGPVDTPLARPPATFSHLLPVPRRAAGVEARNPAAKPAPPKIERRFG